MRIDQAQQLISELGVALGAGPEAYRMSDQGELNLAFSDSVPVQVKFYEGTLIVASILATGVDLDDPGLFPTLMEYQFMGIRTLGCVLSWNSSTDSLLLSRQLYGEPTVENLTQELELVIRATAKVQADLEGLLSGAWEGPAADEAPPEGAPAESPLRPGNLFDRA